jgi:ferritin-like protein
MNDTEKELVCVDRVLNRRSFVSRTGAIGLGAAAATFLSGVSSKGADWGDRDFDDRDNRTGDTAQQIFTAALIAEDLATTFYYNGLIGGVIQDPNLAGTGGTATFTAANGNEGNVEYIRAALSEEIMHANLLRALTGGSNPDGDPVQTFYFPTGTFDTLTPFLSILDALENAFIGAYLNATIEFAEMAADTKAGIYHQVDSTGKRYNSSTLEYYAQVAACIMGIESEHRVLGRVISNTNPANQLCYEQTDGLTSVYNGTKSAVVALTPFLKPGTGKTAYSFQTALGDASRISLPCTGGLPIPPPQPKDDDR